MKFKIDDIRFKSENLRLGSEGIKFKSGGQIGRLNEMATGVVCFRDEKVVKNLSAVVGKVGRLVA